MILTLLCNLKYNDRSLSHNANPVNSFEKQWFEGAAKIRVEGWVDYADEIAIMDDR